MIVYRDIARKLWGQATEVQAEPVAVDLDATPAPVVQLASTCYRKGWPMNRQLVNITLLMLAGF